jgi:hypothetical protein
MNDATLHSFLDKCCGHHDLKKLKMMPLFPDSECHANCFEWCRKNHDFVPVRGWLLVEELGYYALVYHSVVRNKQGVLVDITKRVLHDFKAQWFLFDLEWERRTVLYDRHISFKSNYMIEIETGHITEMPQHEVQAQKHALEIKTITKELFQLDDAGLEQLLLLATGMALR